MKIVHNVGMNMQRLTISMPGNVYQDLVAMFGRGKVSQFVAKATEEKILVEKMESRDPIEAFFAHKQNLPKFTDDQILNAIHQGRT